MLQPIFRHPLRNVADGSFTTEASEHKAGPCPFGPDSDQIVQQRHMTQSVMNGDGFARCPNKRPRVSHKDALRWVTKGSAACIGRPELGEIAVGKAADLALFKLDELRFSGHGDPIAALVLCGAHRADRVMVRGRWVVTDGVIPGLDVADLIRRHGSTGDARGLI
jgi:hypothetical protein